MYIQTEYTYYSRTPLIRPPSESHWCGRIIGMVAREGFVYKQKALSVTRNLVVWEGWSLVRVVVRQGFYCTPKDQYWFRVISGRFSKKKHSEWDLDPPIHFHSNLGFCSFFFLCQAPYCHQLFTFLLLKSFTTRHVCPLPNYSINITTKAAYVYCTPSSISTDRPMCHFDALACWWNRIHMGLNIHPRSALLPKQVHT